MQISDNSIFLMFFLWRITCMYLVILQTLKCSLRCKDMDVFADTCISRHLSYKWVFVHTLVFNVHVYKRPLMFLCIWTNIYLCVHEQTSMLCIYVYQLLYLYICMDFEVFLYEDWCICTLKYWCVHKYLYIYICFDWHVNIQWTVYELVLYWMGMSSLYQSCEWC